MSLLYVVQSAFTVWMMVDCYQRGAAAYWYMMLWIPFGPLVYFFAVKVHDYDLSAIKKRVGIGRSRSIDALRWQLNETDSLANQLALAHALVEAGDEPAEAAGLFTEVVRRDGQNKRARFGLARAQALAGARAEAIATLDDLLAGDPGFADGAGMKLRADLLWDEAHREEALEDLRRLTGRLDYRVAFARRLQESGQAVEAAAVLGEALEGYRHSPRFIQRRDARARREASGLLKTLVVSSQAA
jgi:hypothetical protein